MVASPSSPIVAIAGATGLVGRFLTESFLQALEQSRIRELRILSTKRPGAEGTAKFESSGARVHTVDYGKKDTVLVALKNVDIVVSSLGMMPGLVDPHTVLLEALVQAGVDVYIPSEFGFNHYAKGRSKYDHPVFQMKKRHFLQANSKSGLKVVRVYCNLIMEASFGPLLGFDTKQGVWSIAGQGNTKVAVTASQDIGRFTVEAALLAIKDPTKVPQEGVEIAGDSLTLRQYAGVLDSVSGKQTKFTSTPFKEAEAKYLKTNNFFDLFPIAFEEGAAAVTPEEVNGNQLLNLGESLWKLKKFVDFAQETGGVPA